MGILKQHRIVAAALLVALAAATAYGLRRTSFNFFRQPADPVPEGTMFDLTTANGLFYQLQFGGGPITRTRINLDDGTAAATVVSDQLVFDPIVLTGSDGTTTQTVTVNLDPADLRQTFSGSYFFARGTATSDDGTNTTTFGVHINGLITECENEHFVRSTLRGFESSRDTSTTPATTTFTLLRAFVNGSGIEAEAPAVDIEKATNGLDSDTAPGQTLTVGDTATFTYVVTNPGNVALDNVMVNDDQGVTPTLVSGDTDNDNQLDVGETWTYEATATVTAGQYTNIGTVTAVSTGPLGASVTDSDTSNHFGMAAADNPGVDIEKFTNGSDSDSAPGENLTIGTTAVFVYIVRNTGDVALDTVVVSDDSGTPGTPGDDMPLTRISGDTDNDNQLDESEIWIYIASATVTAGQYTNVGSVSANSTGPSGATVTDSDTANHTGVP